MSAAHTPGPWAIPNGSPPIVIASGKADICVMSGAASNESVMADARLIAAAPGLLAALKYARRFLNPKDHDTKFVDAVIAKAQGAQSNY